MIARIIDKETKLFIKDDFHFNPENEIALTAPPSQGLYNPKWNGESWEEGATQEYIDSLKSEPELDETEKLKIRLDSTENALLFLMEMGGM